jgi:hypothetical protein
MLSRMRSRLSGSPAFCEIRRKRCSVSLSETPGISIDRTVRPSYSELISWGGREESPAAFRGSTAAHSRTIPHSHVVYRFSNVVLGVTTTALRWKRLCRPLYDRCLPYDELRELSDEPQTCHLERTAIAVLGNFAQSRTVGFRLRSLNQSFPELFLRRPASYNTGFYAWNR